MAAFRDLSSCGVFRAVAAFATLCCLIAEYFHVAWITTRVLYRCLARPLCSVSSPCQKISVVLIYIEIDYCRISVHFLFQFLLSM